MSDQGNLIHSFFQLTVEIPTIYQACLHFYDELRKHFYPHGFDIYWGIRQLLNHTKEKINSDKYNKREWLMIAIMEWTWFGLGSQDSNNKLTSKRWIEAN